MNTNTQRPLILAEECFGDDDECGVHVAEVVNADGRTAYWILADLGEDQTPVRIPEHEQVGPLPWRVRSRLEALPTAGRCNAPTKHGTRCRKSATGCPFHAGSRATGALS